MRCAPGGLSSFVLAGAALLTSCGGGTAGSSTASTTAATSGGTQAPITTSEMLAIFQRSCAGCHRHDGGDPAAVENGAYFDTEEDVRRLMYSYGVGIAESGLLSLVAYIERDGELRIGQSRVLMPPAGTSPPITREEAHQILLWWQAETPH